MKLSTVVLRRVSMPLVAPFRTSFGTENAKDALLVEVVTPDCSGWGECVALSAPVYSPEYVDGAVHVVENYCLPALFSEGDLSAAKVAPALSFIKGHPMAKAALEMAVLDAELRTAGLSLARHLGAVRDRVPSGVSVGILRSIDELLEVVEGYLAAGYVRIKLKIEPGWDLAPVRAVRERFGDVLLQVDANTAYTVRDAELLAKLDAFDLLLIEQPLEEDDLRGHAELARRIRTPICLDESVTSARGAADAIAIGACSVVNIKAGRVGGYLEARRIAAICAASGVAVWCGGMIETGLGRAANAALAALPEFTLPGDVSGSDRFFSVDITEPITMRDGYVTVPNGLGLGVQPLPEVLEECTTWSRTFTS